ncbi:MAG: peptidase U32 family protein, partial [Ruthenibacterium sp.]
MFKKPEVLSPAGDLERLQFAVRYGADAVYVGGETFGMRTSSKNFTIEQLAEGARFAHANGARVYLTLNSVPTNEEIARLPDYVRRVRETGIDAFIVADLGVLSIVKKFAPEIEVHFSTQVGIANFVAASAAYDLGAKRVVLARELSIEDIAVIRDNTPPDLELEAFVHGAM